MAWPWANVLKSVISGKHPDVGQQNGIPLSAQIVDVE